MIATKITGAVIGIIGMGTVAMQALDFSPCSTYDVRLVNPVVTGGDHLLVQFLVDRRIQGCRVFADYRIFDGRGTEIYSWQRDVKAPGAVGESVWTVPLPIIGPAYPGEGHLAIAISFVKNPVQQALYSLTGWTTTAEPIELDFTIKPTENPA